MVAVDGRLDEGRDPVVDADARSRCADEAEAGRRADGDRAREDERADLLARDGADGEVAAGADRGVLDVGADLGAAGVPSACQPMKFCAIATPIEAATPAYPPPPIATEAATTVAVIADVLAALIETSVVARDLAVGDVGVGLRRARRSRRPRRRR